MNQYLKIGGAALIVILLGLGIWWWLSDNLKDQIVIPFIQHQKPQIDPHLPHSVHLSDKLDEVLFEGLFNISANASGIVYEDALGELITISDDNIVTIRLNTAKKWHNSFNVTVEDEEVNISPASDVLFAARDLNFTLNRIKQLGSLSPDYILVSQALKTFSFEGPDNNNEIRFSFKDDRIWTENDIKEVLAFKILPANSELAARNYFIGTGPYLAVSPGAEVSSFYRNPAETATISRVNLAPFVDNSTFTTELKNGNFNTLLETPFGALSPILENKEDFFTKSNISTSFFALLFNTERLNRDQRNELRKLINNRTLINRFFKTNSPQQRHIVDYRGKQDNYGDYLNYSVFPSTTYYVEEDVVVPIKPEGAPDLSILPDSIRIVASLNHGHREEYRELIEIFNDPGLFQNRIRAYDVSNDDIKRGNYDALLIAIDGYKSTFLFDLYNIFLREPDLDNHKINLITRTNSKGEVVTADQSLAGSNNFCRLDASRINEDQEDVRAFLTNMYGFMYSNHIGDKQFYAQYVNDFENKLALGSWLFSLPSLAYFSTQFDPRTIDLYGVASQLSTIEKWQEKKDN